MKILHFADAHIDMANYGKQDPASGLPFRVLDFLKSLDAIIDTAINEKVDLVLFAGDAYKDRNPQPTFQREWGRRIMRLSRAGIPTLLLAGNHDTSPSVGRAHSFQEFDTLEVPHVRLISKPGVLKPHDLENLPLQVIALPWINRSAVAAARLNAGSPEVDTIQSMAETVTLLLEKWFSQLDPSLPAILLAHCSVEGAAYGGERNVMLGADFTLPPSVVRDQRLDYTALGHIHKMQNLNEGMHPPVVYPGSIERVDAGEAGDDKYYVIAEVQKGSTRVEFRKLEGIRKFIVRDITPDDRSPMTDQLIHALGEKDNLRDAIVRLVVHYSPEDEKKIDHRSLKEHVAEAFEFHFIPRKENKARVRLPSDMGIEALAPIDLAEAWFRQNHFAEKDIEGLKTLAIQIMREVHDEGGISL